MFKLSLYNIIISSLSTFENIYIYNSKSGAIIKLEKNVYDELVSLNFDSEIVKKYTSELLRQGIIVKENKNEIQEILHEIKAKQYEKTGMLSLVIAPTLKCNYRCAYCFENSGNIKQMMSMVEIENIIEFIKKYLDKYPQTHKIYVHWFGGEPLLAYRQVISPLSNLLIELAKEKNIEYDSGIVTNGYLLNEDVLVSLVEQYHISDFQITFDGREENYNRMKRPPVGAYQVTKNNILKFSKYQDLTQKPLTINIRINVDKTNVNDAKLFVQEIQRDVNYKNNLRFYIARIRGTEDSFDIQEFENFENEFNTYINKPFNIFSPKKIWCNQYTFNSFCIGPHGELYKCEHDFGCEDRIIGDTITGLYYNEYLDKYMNQLIAECCKECKAFPVCLGGCPNGKFHSSVYHSCEFTVNNLIKHAEKYILLQKQKV